MKFVNEKKRGQCVNSELLGPQFSPFSLAFYFSLANILFCPRLIRAFFSVFADWHRSRNFLTGVTLYHPQDEALHLIVAFTLLVLCTGCSCTKVAGTTMEPTEATLQPANSAKRIQPLDLLKRFHKRGINCPDGRSSRPSGDTCCLLSSNGYGCCPLTNAVCCNDGVHCCPEGYSRGSGGDCYK